MSKSIILLPQRSAIKIMTQPNRVSVLSTKNSVILSSPSSDQLEKYALHLSNLNANEKEYDGELSKSQTGLSGKEKSTKALKNGSGTYGITEHYISAVNNGGILMKVQGRHYLHDGRKIQRSDNAA